MKNVERIYRGRRSWTGFAEKSVDNNKKKLEIVESEVMELRKGRKREQRVDRRLQDISRAAPTAGELIRQAAYTLGGHTLSNKDKVKRIVNETLKEFHLKSLPDSIIRPHVNKIFSPWKIGKTRRWHYIHHIIYIYMSHRLCTLIYYREKDGPKLHRFQFWRSRCDAKRTIPVQIRTWIYFIGSNCTKAFESIGTSNGLQRFIHVRIDNNDWS